MEIFRQKEAPAGLGEITERQEIQKNFGRKVKIRGFHTGSG